MAYREEICVDAGSENCPCPLAESGDCIVCSRLQGQDRCQCSWSGVCIYNEYIQNYKKIDPVRKNQTTKILKKIWYDQDLLVLVLQVGKGFALKAAVPGSYVFLKPCGMGECYSVPISVMRADVEKGQLHLAVKVTAGKTKALAAVSEEVEVRGIYRNGLLGISKLKQREKQRVLCITKGIGFAPAVNYNDWAFGKDTVDMMIDPDKINQELVNDYLQKSPVRQIRYIDLSKGTPAMDADAYDVILVLASDYYIETLEVPREKMVHSNNFHMCCGEGICGACTMVDAKGISHKMCKCQMAYDL